MAFYRGDGGAGTGNIEVQPIAIGVGGTGATTSAQARTNLGLGTAAVEAASAFATAAQGTKADTAIQPADLASVATSGDYNDLSNKPTIPADVSDLTDTTNLLFSGDYNDLTNTPTINSGTVSSVAMTVPTGLTVSGTPITTSGTLAVTFDTGYSIPTSAKQTEWDTAYGWGDHSVVGYLTSETYTGTVTSVAASVPAGFVVTGSPITSSGTLAIAFDTGYALPTTAKQTNWDTAYGWGNHASAGYLTSETYLGTVTSVAMTVPTGLEVSGTPITSSGTLAVTLATGYSIPTTSSQSNWDTAYGWGDHAAAGYLTTAPVTSVAGKTGAVTLASSDVGLGNVENTALSTWAGSSNITTLGTVTTGTIAGGTY